MREVRIEGDGWYIELVIADDKSGSLETSLHQGYQDELAAAEHGVTSLVLAQACAGIDVETPAYKEALSVAINTVHQRYA